MQRSAAEVAEYLPAPHSAHELAPARVPVFVIEPGSHSMQDESVEASEYVPAAHGVHVVAPDAEPLSVIDPAAHSEQYDLPSSD